MKFNLKKTSIALAVAAASGVTFAAPVTKDLTRINTDEVLGNNYVQTIGSRTVDVAAGTLVSERDIAPGIIVSKTDAVVDGPEVQIDGINYRNYTYQEVRKGTLQARKLENSNTTVDGTQTIARSWDNTTATGEATRTANTRVEIEAVADIAVEIDDTRKRLADTKFDFAADNVDTVIGARTTSSKGSFEAVNATENADDDRNVALKFQIERSDLTTQAKLGADGKPVAGQTIRVGTVNEEFSVDAVNYKRTTNADNITTSKNASGILSSVEVTSAQHEVADAYQTNGDDVVAFKLGTNKKSITESTVNTDKSTFSRKNVNYDDVNAAGLDYTTEVKSSYDNSKESLLDGFVAVNKGTEESSFTQFNQGKNALDYIDSSKSTSESKKRNFVKNADGEIVLTDGKPTVNTETEIKNTAEIYDSRYQATRYKAGEFEGDAYNQHILNDGTRTAWTDDSNVAKSVAKATSSKVVTHKQDNDFQEHWNTSSEFTAEYARNQQEHIEVNRDLVAAETLDKKVLSKMTGVSVVTAAQADDFKIGTVAVDVTGEKFTASDVKSWTDAEGKERYYVVIGDDAAGQQIRSEVTFVSGKPSETQAAEIQTVTTKVTSDKRTDKVTMGEEVAYQTNEKSTKDKQVTSKDGDIVYSAKKSSDETDVKVYSVGKNALDREAVTNQSGETVATNFDKVGDTNEILFKDGQPVIVSVDSDKWTSSKIDRLFQAGQDKTNENISTSSYEGNSKNAAGVVQSTWNGHENSTTADYAVGNELAHTIVKDKADEETAKTVTQNVGFNYDGTAKANINSNTLREDGTVANGLAVSAAQAGNIVVDTQWNATNNEDTKTYQDGGVKAYESTTAKTDVRTVTYADGTMGTVKNAADNQASTVTLFNKGKADKYREAVKTTESETTGKMYKTDADGDIILVDGKPVESGTGSNQETVKTTENLYQIGQERKTDTLTVTNTSDKSTNVDGSSRDLVAQATDEQIDYRAGQTDGKKSESNTTASSELTVKNADTTGYTYKVDHKGSNVTNDTEQYLLASRDVSSVAKTEWTESLAASGKDTVSITRGTEDVKRTDSSATATKYGSETVATAGGATTTLAKKEATVTDKFGIVDSSTLSRTETKVATDKSSTVNTTTRVDSVDGVVLSATQTNTDTANKTVTTNHTATLNANGLTANQVTADRISVGGKDLQGELSRLDSRADQLNRNIDNVQKSAYRGIAIALAAQQAVPSIQPGQVAVFGGVGHYEGETAGSIGVVTAFTDRISASGAFGFAGGSEFGGRVGVAYVFGGK